MELAQNHVYDCVPWSLLEC